MWETLSNIPLGRLSMRKYLRFATALLVVCFVYIFTTAPTSYAADANWNAGTITYKDNKYENSGVSKGTESHKIPEGSRLYIYGDATDIASNIRMKAYVIYFAPGSDPGTATSAFYQTFDFKGGNDFSNPSPRKTITIKPNTESAVESGTTSCAIEGIGFVICPVTKFLAKGMDIVYDLVDGFLEVKPLQTVQDQAMYRAWSFMRNFANIAFVIGFLIIIYSQLSNVGLSNYDIKKMLPRIVVAAVLVNTSYWICAIAIDLFNILGYSVQDVFISIRNSLVGSEGNSWDVISWESITSLILSGGSLAAGTGIAAFLGITSIALVTAGTTGTVALSGLIFILLPILLSVLFVILITFLILAARQAIITILVIIAPLAFVAYLLPNTEKWFEKWRSALFTLLLLFPAFSLVFGGSQLAAAAIIQNANSVSIILLAMAVQVAPLAITPLLLKLGGGVLNRFANIVNNPTKGIFDRGKNWARERTDQNKSRGRAHLDQRAKERGFQDGRPNGGSWKQRTRLNPNNMAYLREYDRRDREGAKTANEAMSEGLFTQTAAGRRIHDRTKNAGLEKHYGEATNLEAYNNAVYGTPGIAGSGDHYRQHLHHESHLATGRAKLIEDAATSNAEFDLRAQINDPTGPLRQIKIDSDVYNARANLETQSVEADGKLAFQNHVDNDRALKLMKVATFVAEKEATSIETRLTKNAETRWDQISRTDPRLQHIRLSETVATTAATDAEEKWNSLVENVRAKGNARNSAGNLIVKDLDAGNASLAGSLRALHHEIETEKSTQSSAKLVQQTEFTDALNNSVQLRNRAAGVDRRGASRVLAAAKAAVTKELITNTDNFQNTLDYNEVQSNIDELKSRFESLPNDPSFMPERVAYARLLAKNGSPGVNALRDVLTKYTDGLAPDEENVLLLKEILAGEQSIRSASRDLEVWANNERDDNGNLYTNFEAVTNTLGVWKSITGQRFASMAQPAQEHALKILQENDPPALKRLVGRITQDSVTLSNIKDKPLLMLEAIQRGEDISNF